MGKGGTFAWSLEGMNRCRYRMSGDAQIFSRRDFRFFQAERAKKSLAQQPGLITAPAMLETSRDVHRK